MIDSTKAASESVSMARAAAEEISAAAAASSASQRRCDSASLAMSVSPKSKAPSPAWPPAPSLARSCSVMDMSAASLRQVAWTLLTAATEPALAGENGCDKGTGAARAPRVLAAASAYASA